tara:strand:- start:372 stop:2543 length:2172 start_codon:yes stop_codon:yes gene_type:complete
MSSTVITSDMLNKIISDNEQMKNRCDDLIKEIDHEKSICKFKSTIIENNNSNFFQILPKVVKNDEENVSQGVDLNIGSQQFPFSRVLINDFFMIHNNNTYVKQIHDDSHTKLLDALTTQKILDVIQSLNIKSTPNEDLVVEDPYHFMSLSSRKELFFNQSKFMISLLVYLKSIDSRLLTSETKNSTGGTFEPSSGSESDIVSKKELIELTEQFDSVIRDFDTNVKKNAFSIQKLNGLYTDCSTKVNQLWESVLNEVQNANSTFETQQCHMNSEINHFKESRQKYDEFQNCTEENICCMQDRINGSEESLKNIVNNNNNNHTKINKLESVLQECEEKLTLINNVVIDHSKRVSVIDNIDKVIQNNFNDVNSFVQQHNEAVDSKFSSFNENTSNEFINLLTKIGEVNNDLSSYRNITKENMEGISKTISQLVTKLNEIDTHQKHSAISTNNRFSEINDNFRQHLQNTTESVTTSFQQIENVNSQVKKNNQDLSVEMSRKIDDLINQNRGQTQHINKLNSKLQQKDEEISTLNEDILSLKKQFAEFKNVFDKQNLNVASLSSLKTFQAAAVFNKLDKTADAASETGSVNSKSNVSDKSESIERKDKVTPKMVTSHRTGEPLIGFLKTSLTEKKKNVLNIQTETTATETEATRTSNNLTDQIKAVVSQTTVPESSSQTVKRTVKAKSSETPHNKVEVISDTNSEASSSTNTSIKRTRVYVKKQPGKN